MPYIYILECADGSYYTGSTWDLQRRLWERKSVTLGEICEFKYGKSLPDAKRAGGCVPAYGSNGIVGEHRSHNV